MNQASPVTLFQSPEPDAVFSAIALRYARISSLYLLRNRPRYVLIESGCSPLRLSSAVKIVSSQGDCLMLRRYYAANAGDQYDESRSFRDF